MAANLIKIDTTACNANYTVFLSTPQGLGRYLTIKDTGTNAPFFASNSIVVSTTSGYTFFGGSSTEYIRNTKGSLSFTAMYSNWRLLNTVPYTTSGQAVLSNISTTNLFVNGTFSTIGQVAVHNNMVVSGTADVQNIPTVQGVPLVIVGNLVSTVSGLGSLGFISSFSLINTSFISTVNKLGTYGFISSTQLQSTVTGLGMIGYISQASVLSTFQGLGSTYFSTLSLVSTVQDLGKFGYISTISLTSTVQGLQGIQGIQYVTIDKYASTITSLSNIISSNTVSTNNGLGLIGYISSTQLQSTFAGLGTSGYISVSQLTSTVTGLSNQNTCNLISTVLNLGKHYISTGHMISTISGISNVNAINITSTITGLGSSKYISIDQLKSTVVGLGTSKYISIDQLTSTVDGINSTSLTTLTSTTAGLGALQYISIDQLVSTVTGFSNLNASNMISSTNTLAIVGGTMGYISSLSLQSTVAGLGSSKYISLGDLISTTIWYSNNTNPIPSTVAGLGTFGYISTESLTSTFSVIQTIVTNLPYINGNGSNFTSLLSNTVKNLGTTQPYYLSTPNLTSTVAGLGTFGYLSKSVLVSTINGIVQIPPATVASGLGTTYASKAQLISSVTSTQSKPIFNLDSFQVTTVLGGLTNIIRIGELSSSNLLYTTTTNYIYNVNTTTKVATQLLNTAITSAFNDFAINPNTNKLYNFYTDKLMEYDISAQSGTVYLTQCDTGYLNGTNFLTVAFNNTQGIAFDSSYSNLYVCDWGNSAIRRVQISPLSVTTVCSILNPYLITLDSYSRYAYVITTSNATHRIYKIGLFQNNPTPILQSAFSTFIQQYQSGSTDANYHDMKLDPSNTYMYLTLGITNSNNTILQYNLNTDSGILLGLSNTTGFTNGPLVPSLNASNARFNYPGGLVYSKYNNCLYVTDNGNSNIRKITVPLFTSTIAGLNAFRVVKTITTSNANIITANANPITAAQSNYFLVTYNDVLNSNLTTTPNMYLSNSTIYMDSAEALELGNTVTAATFKALNAAINTYPGFYFGDGTYVTTISDSRLKENVHTLSNALQIVRGLQAVSYTKDKKRWIGYIAQDVEEVLPIVVGTDDSPNKWKSIQYTNLPGLLIEAIKELRAKYSRIEALLSNASRPS